EWWREVYGHNAKVALRPSETVDGRECYVVSVRDRDRTDIVWWIDKRRGVFYRCEVMPSEKPGQLAKVQRSTYRLILFPDKIDDSAFRLPTGAAAVAGRRQE